MQSCRSRQLRIGNRGSVNLSYAPESVLSPCSRSLAMGEDAERTCSGGVDSCTLCYILWTKQWTLAGCTRRPDYFSRQGLALQGHPCMSTRTAFMPALAMGLPRRSVDPPPWFAHTCRRVRGKSSATLLAASNGSDIVTMAKKSS